MDNNVSSFYHERPPLIFYSHGKHGNKGEPGQHCTMRAYIGDQAVATMHVFMDESTWRATGIDVWSGGVGMTTKEKDLVG